MSISKLLGFDWSIHGDGRSIQPGSFVAPNERLAWPITIGIGAQHVVAMFGATFLVPIITGFPPATTLFFSGLGTVLFLLITRGRVPSYLGSSFAFIAPLAAAMNSHGPAGALGGIVMAGIALFLVGLIVQFAGTGWLTKLMPPVVTGSIVALIGFNLAKSAKDNFMVAPVTALVTLCSIILISVLFKGIIGRLSILLGVGIGYITAVIRGEVDFSKIDTAVQTQGIIGLPQFQTPEFHWELAGLFIPVILVLVAENIGVMAATKVYSTAAYWVAAIFAIALSMFPAFGAAIATVPAGVLGGAATVLYGMIGMLGARIWSENRVNFSNQINLTTAAVALIVGIADYTWTFGELSFAGIALGTAATLIIFHLMTFIAKYTKAAGDPLEPFDPEKSTEVH